MSLAPEVKLATLLSDEVRYSYAALTALVFHQLYPGKEDTDLRNRHLGMLLQHFSLDHASDPTTLILLYLQKNIVNYRQYFLKCNIGRLSYGSVDGKRRPRHRTLCTTGS